MAKNNRKKHKNVGKLKAEINNILDEIVGGYIDKFESKYNRQPSEKEIDNMYKKAKETLFKNIKRFGVKMATRVTFIGMAFVAGFAIGGKDEVKGITDGKEGIQIESTLLKDDININNFDNQRDIFINGVKVDIQTIETLDAKQKEADQIKMDVEKDFANLQTKEEVYKYVKNLYAENYNATHEDKINLESIIFSREREGLPSFLIYKDENGICRITTSKEQAEKVGHKIEGNNSSKIEIFAETENGKQVKEMFTNYNYREYNRLYEYDEVVQDKSNLSSINIAKVVDTAISYATSIGKEGTSFDVREGYRNDCLDAIIKMRLEEINSLQYKDGIVIDGDER